MATASTPPSESSRGEGIAASGSKTASGTGIAFRPLQVTWEMTGACEWRISPTRLGRLPHNKREVSTAEAYHLIQEVAALRVPLFVLTGGDPLLRPDVFPIVEFASRRSVRTSMTLVPTSLLDSEAITELKSCGLMRAAFWLNGSTASLHDASTGVSGTHRRTLEMIGACHEVGLPVQINTMVSRRNQQDVEPLAELLSRLDIILWNVFFLVPPDRDHAQEMLNAAEHEDAFSKLYAASRRVQYQIKTSEGPHYQRYLLQQRVKESKGRLRESDVMTRAQKGMNDSRAVVFVNREGYVYPSRYLPVAAGNICERSLAEIFYESELLQAFRDTSRLQGKCGKCPVRNLCGGSRARAYALSGDLFAEDPGCAYET
jgi:radical SAM protein with 4Fe4S-binding SPASM domain